MSGVQFERKLVAAVVDIIVGGLMTLAGFAVASDSSQGTSGQRGMPLCLRDIAPAVPDSPPVPGCRLPVGD
jgi:hypothetical protein